MSTVQPLKEYAAENDREPESNLVHNNLTTLTPEGTLKRRDVEPVHLYDPPYKRFAPCDSRPRYAVPADHTDADSSTM
jgi:hypothetical protein